MMIAMGVVVIISCQNRELKWAGKFENQNGVTIVENYGRPIYDEKIFSLTEEMSLGNGAESEDLFSSIYDFDIDSEGNFYVLDRRAAYIRIFDSEGRFQRSFGKKGQGPGEFQAPHIFRNLSGWPASLLRSCLPHG